MHVGEPSLRSKHIVENLELLHITAARRARIFLVGDLRNDGAVCLRICLHLQDERPYIRIHPEDERHRHEIKCAVKCPTDRKILHQLLDHRIVGHPCLSGIFPQEVYHLMRRFHGRSEFDLLGKGNNKGAGSRADIEHRRVRAQNVPQCRIGFPPVVIIVAAAHGREISCALVPIIHLRVCPYVLHAFVKFLLPPGIPKGKVRLISHANTPLTRRNAPVQ